MKKLNLKLDGIRMTRDQMKKIVGGSDEGGGEGGSSSGGGSCFYHCCTPAHTGCGPYASSTKTCTSYTDCANNPNVGDCAPGGHLFYNCF